MDIVHHVLRPGNFFSYGYQTIVFLFYLPLPSSFTSASY